MTATLWERLGGIGEGASDPIDLDAFIDTLLLHGQDKLTGSAAKTRLGLSAAESDEYDDIILRFQPPDMAARMGWALFFRAACRAARAGESAFNSVADLQAGIGPQYT